jgi:hypothetical protein
MGVRSDVGNGRQDVKALEGEGENPKKCSGTKQKASTPIFHAWVM